jgi:hypothetical protein
MMPPAKQAAVVDVGAAALVEGFAVVGVAVPDAGQAPGVAALAILRV